MGRRGASWLEVIEQLESQGLTIPPKLAIGDGALGFWKALAKKWPQTAQQRCWVHKTANVLNKVPKSVQPKVKANVINLVPNSLFCLKISSIQHHLKESDMSLVPAVPTTDQAVFQKII